ncbi:MAG: DUF5908 family protein [Synechococcus sp.]
MPIEIREMVIRAQVDSSDDCSENNQESPNTASSSSHDDMIRTCVQEVLRVLEDRGER